MSKAKRRRNKKARKAKKGALVGVGQKTPKPVTAPAQRSAGATARPTPERMARGTWAEPQGPVKSEQPMVDIECDMIGHLLATKQITNAQEQAARTYQEIQFRYMDEIPDVGGFKSCLAGGSGGYDASDGSPEIVAEYRRICRKVGLIGERELFDVCVMGHRPRNIQILCKALDRVAA